GRKVGSFSGLPWQPRWFHLGERRRSYRQILAFVSLRFHDEYGRQIQASRRVIPWGDLEGTELFGLRSPYAFACERVRFSNRVIPASNHGGQVRPRSCSE